MIEIVKKDNNDDISIKSIIPNLNNKNFNDNAMAIVLLDLVKELKKATEYTPKGLRDESLLKKHKCLKPFIKNLKKNRKHYKRQYTKEILQAIEQISKSLERRNDNSVNIGNPYDRR